MSGLAQWSNQLRLTARFYEPLWRQRSVALMTRGAYSTERELAAMIERAARREGLSVHFLNDDVHDLPFADASYRRGQG